MKRSIASVLGGLLVWGLTVTILNWGLRALLPGYHGAEATLQFTAAMKAGRLIEAAASSVLAGIVTRWIAPRARIEPWLVGLILLLLFVPVHVQIWSRLPAWYHLTFLLTLAPLVALGALIPLRSHRTHVPSTV